MGLSKKMIIGLLIAATAMLATEIIYATCCTCMLC